jgi:putative FmdB family regulatory protein
MPIYEYRRPDGSTFEVVQSFSDDALAHDPETGVKVQRVLHAPAVHFKGKGFYNTDYGTRKRQRENQAAGEGASAESGSGEAGGGGEKGAGESAKKPAAEGASDSKAKTDGAGATKKKSEPAGAKG